MSNKVLVGMSGGVDSSVSALLLKQKGYDVIGCTMILHNEDEGIESISDAKKVCEKLGINHIICNYTNEFNKRVIDNFVCNYKNCKTPNPCIECNRFLKFGMMYEKAKELSCDYIATGHYAIIEYDERYNKKVLKKSKSQNKDQSYVLYNINPELLDKILLPLGDFSSKDEIRKIAKENDLEVASKKDSEDICFIPDNNYANFLEEKKGFKPIEGNIVNKKGEILGKHKGLYKYTIGQRKGLGISYEVPLYVIGYNIDKNELIVGREEELYTKDVYLNNFNNLLGIDINNLKVNAKIRYSAKEAKATITNENGIIKVSFEESQKAVTPGQSLVAYIDDVVVGGGIIEK